jgi:DNA-binding response OmpR family regulator
MPFQYPGEQSPDRPSSDTRQPDLEGVRVVIVMHDIIQGEGMADYLEKAGATVVGLARSVQEAAGLAQGAEVGAVIFDSYMGDRPAYELARDFRKRGVPALFVTGQRCGEVPPEVGKADCIEKPYTGHELVQAVARAVGGNACA